MPEIMKDRNWNKSCVKSLRLANRQPGFSYGKGFGGVFWLIKI